jgi:hypothetical protein
MSPGDLPETSLERTNHTRRQLNTRYALVKTLPLPLQFIPRNTDDNDCPGQKPQLPKDSPPGKGSGR